MSSAVCPYCRGTIDAGVEEPKVCPGCGTPHHADCFEENGGCTVFGCSAAPAEEPKLSLSASDVAAGVSNPAAPRAVGSSLPSTLHLDPIVQPPAPAPVVAPVRVKAPPPPMPNAAPVATVATALPTPRYGSGSVLFGAQPVAAVATSAPAADLDFDFEDNPNAKNRITFIVLGVLLGMFGAHNFYAGYTKKAIAQILISVLSLGFASPMVWVWAVIDICTVFSDSKGVKFRS
jgi:TM2 domain-containing protein/RING finger family protein